MRTSVKNWFESSLRYEKMSDEGSMVKVTERYALSAETFADAEASMNKYAEGLCSGEFKVKRIDPATYGEVFFSDVESEDNWYCCVVDLRTVNEAGKLKHNKVKYLVQGSSIPNAVSNIKKVFDGTMLDYVVTDTRLTNIIEVLEEVK